MRSRPLQSLVLALSVAVQPLFANECEHAVYPAVKSILGIFEAALKTGDLDLPKLIEIWKSKTVEDPFAERTDRTLAFRIGFARAKHYLLAEHHHQFFQQLNQLIERRSKQAAAVNEAKEQTADILAMKMGESLDGIAYRGTDLTPITYQGRTAFVGPLLRGGQSEPSNFLIDPFRTDKPNLKYVLIPIELDYRSAQVIHYKGKDYFLNKDHPWAFDLETLQNSKISNEAANSYYTGTLEPRFFTDGNVIRMITGYLPSSFVDNENAFSGGDSQGNENLQPHLGFVDLTPQGEFKKVIEGEISKFYDLQLQIPGHAYMAAKFKDETEYIRLIDFSGTPRVVFSIALEGANSNADDWIQSPLVFMRDGKKMALVHHTLIDYPKFGLSLMEIGKSETIHPLNLGNDLNVSAIREMQYFEIKGVPYAFLSAWNTLTHVLNLQTLKVEWRPPADAVIRQVQVFEWKGEPYILSVGKQARELQIYSLTTGSKMAHLDLPNIHIAKFNIFYREGKPQALVIPATSSAPFFVHLSRKEDK